MKTRNKILFLLTGIIGTVALLVIILYFSLPGIINSEVIQKRLNAYLFRETGGCIAVQKSEVRLLPLPHIVLREISLIIPDKATGLIHAIDVYPDVWSLIRGEVKFSELGLESPRVTVAIFEEKKKKSLEEIEGKMRAVLQVLNSVAPDAVLRIQDGRLDLTKMNRVAFSCEAIQSRLNTSGKSLHISLTCASNLWDSLSFNASLRAEDLKSSGTVQITNLRPHDLFAQLDSEIAGHIGDSEADVSVNFHALGLRQIQAEVTGALPRLILTRGHNSIKIKDLNLKGDLDAEPKSVSVVLGELNSSDPEMKISGQYTLDQTSGIMELNLAGKSIDVQSIRASALALGGDIPVIRTIFDYVRGGKIPAFQFRTSGKAGGDLGRLENMRISGNMVGGDISIPAKDLSFHTVSGDVVIVKGILEGKNIDAKIGNHHGGKGNVRVGLKGKDALFHLDMLVKADMAELPSMLRQKNLIKNEAVLREMDRLSDTQGTAQGRLILGDRLDSIHVVTDISQVNLTARYEPLPFPLTITGGKVFFDEKCMRISAMDADLGHSSFSNVTAELNFDDQADFKISSGTMRLSADELYPWITSSETTKAVLEQVSSIQGRISVSAIDVRGSLPQPKDWKYLLIGELNGVSIDSLFFPGRIEGASGTFRLTNDELSLKDVGMRMADGTFTISGTATKFPSEIRKLDLSAQGEAGPKITAWISGLMDLPPEMSLRTPISMRPAKLLWNKGATTDFDGTMVFGGETRVSLRLSKSPEELSVHQIKINDGATDIAAHVLLNRKTVDVAFKGIVASDSLKNIFAHYPLSDSSLEGDFRTHVILDDPKQFVAEGTLRGKNLQLPWKYDMPLAIQKISLEASGRKVEVDSAEFSIGEKRFNGKGTIDASQGVFFVDIDLFSQGFDWEMIEKISGGTKTVEGTPQTESLADIPLRGTIRLQSDSFSYRQFRWEPLHADVSFDGGTIRIRSKNAALCGISTTGDIDITDQGAELDIALIAKNLEVEPTILCISDKQVDVTGKFDMKADIRASGKIDSIAKSLNGSFTVSSQKGKIYKAQSLDKTLDLVNKTENVKGTLPDLNKTIIDYRAFGASGTIKENMVNVERATLDASSFGIFAQGQVDLAHETIDLNALVAPVNFAQGIVGKIPVLGKITGGSLVSIPVKIKGSINDPEVSFLSPSAIGSAFVGMMERTIKLPISIIEPILPGKPQQ